MNDKTGAPTAGPTDDAELVSLAQDGDAAAMEQLLTRHFGYVHNLCRRMLRDPIDAEDARQDALIQAARMIATFDGRSSFRTWLHSLTRNVCLNAIRSASRRAVPVADPLQRRSDAARPPAGRHTQSRLPTATPHDRTAERLDLDSALAAVTPVHREALVLWFIADMDYAQIAETLDIPINTVRSRLRRGKAELVELIGEPADLAAVSKQPRAQPPAEQGRPRTGWS